MKRLAWIGMVLLVGWLGFSCNDEPMCEEQCSASSECPPERPHCVAPFVDLLEDCEDDPCSCKARCTSICAKEAFSGGYCVDDGSCCNPPCDGQYCAPQVGLPTMTETGP